MAWDEIIFLVEESLEEGSKRARLATRYPASHGEERDTRCMKLPSNIGSKELAKLLGNGDSDRGRDQR